MFFVLSKVLSVLLAVHLHGYFCLLTAGLLAFANFTNLTTFTGLFAKRENKEKFFNPEEIPSLQSFYFPVHPPQSYDNGFLSAVPEEVLVVEVFFQIRVVF